MSGELGHVMRKGSGGGRFIQEGGDSLGDQPSRFAQAEGVPRRCYFQGLNQESPGKTKMSSSHLGL